MVLLKNEAERVFDTSVTRNIDKVYDKEAKILEEVAAKLGENYSATGSIDSYTKF